MLVELEKIYLDFEQSIKRVEEYINAYMDINSIEINFMKNSKFYKKVQSQIEEIQRNFSETKIVKYNAIIISLYGCFELVIKKSTKAMIRYMLTNNIGAVDELKRENLASVIRAIERSDVTTKGQLIAGLDLLYNKNDMSGYNYKLSLNSYQNLKVNVVYELAKTIGINDLQQQIKANPILIDYIQQEQGLSNKETVLQYINSGVALFSEIDDLVEHRNRIAHEGYEPSMMSDSVIKQSLIPKLKLFASIYIRILQLELLKLCNTQSGYFYEINLLRDVINKHIICFNTGVHNIDKKSVLLIINGNKYSLAKIKNIQIDNINVEKADENKNVGCELDVNVKNSYKFYLFLGNP